MKETKPKEENPLVAGDKNDPVEDADTVPGSGVMPKENEDTMSGEEDDIVEPESLEDTPSLLADDPGSYSPSGDEDSTRCKELGVPM